MNPARDDVISEPPEYERMLDLMAQVRQQHGHGNVAQLDRRLGYSEGYLGRVLRREIRLGADTLIRILRALDIEPGVFFQQIFPDTFDAVAGLAFLHRRMVTLRLPDGRQEPPPTPGDRALLHRLDTRSARRQPAAAEVTWCAEGTFETLADVGRLILDVPKVTAERLAQWLNKRLDEEPDPPTARHDAWLAQGLSQRAAALLAAERPSLACRHVTLAWRLAATPAMRLQVLCTLSGLARHCGAPELARLACVRAMNLGLRCQELSAVGSALLQQAEIQLRDEAWSAAVMTLQAALSYLPQDAVADRMQAHLGVGQGLLGQGDPAAATHLQRAEALHPNCRGLTWCRLMELRGALAEQQQTWSTAATLYRGVRKAYDDIGRPAATLLALLRETRVQLIRGRHEDLMQGAAGAMALMRPLRRQPVMCKVIYDVARLALTGELTTEWLHEAERRLLPLTKFHRWSRDRK